MNAALRLDMPTEPKNEIEIDQAALDRAAERAAKRAAAKVAAAAVAAALAEAIVSDTSAEAAPDDVGADARADIAIDALAALLGDAQLTEARRETVRIAVRLGADVDALREIVTATRVSRSEAITLPAGRYAHLSRGRNWQRRNDGVFVDGAVGPGKWTVGSTDGFNRKDKTAWTVIHVQVGAQTWTAAS